MKPLLFYFDFASPYSYLSWVFLTRHVKDLQKRGVQLVAKPVMMGSLVTRYVDKGPAQIPPKRDFLFRQALRLANLHHIELNVPVQLLFNPMLALRLGLSEVTGDKQTEVIDQLFKMIWVKGERVDDPERVAHLLSQEFSSTDVQQWMIATSGAQARSELKLNLKQAAEQGCFGVPSIIHNEELFWGFESLGFLLQEIEGKNTYSQEQMQKFLHQVSHW
jgi:2-hydroxychromene-2-carboxylate isomerase